VTDRSGKLNLSVSSHTYLYPSEAIPPCLLSKIKGRLTFTNPEYDRNNRLGKSTWATPEQICGYDMIGDTLVIPRGFTRQLVGLLRNHNVRFEINDKRRTLPDVEFSFLGSLKGFQAQAVRTVLSRSFGTLQAPTGSGKTVIALATIAHRTQPALVLVHTRELLNQWVDRIQQFLGIPKKEIGIIGGGKRVIGQGVTVGIVNSIYPITSKIKEHFGFLIVDECHRCPSRMFTEAVSAFDSKFMLGLSATPYRRDRLTRLIYWNLGDRLHEIEQSTLEATGDVLKAEVITRETDFVSSWDASERYSQMLSELTEDRDRNEQIIDDVVNEARKGSGVILIISDRRSHCETLSLMLSNREINSDTLTGDLSNGTRKDIVERLNAGQVKVLIATGQLIGEGFDCKSLSTLFLACPIKFSGRLIQYLGRVLRPAPGKNEALVYDYVDSKIGVLENAARARQRVYAKA